MTFVSNAILSAISIFNFYLSSILLLLSFEP
jgi:hypothetical protein